MVGQDGVVVDDPLGQFEVKGVDVCKEKILVVINELFCTVRLKRSLCAFILGHHG